MLELRAIYFNHCPSVSEENLSRRFYNSRLAGTGRTEEQQIAHRPARRIQSSTEDLEHIHKGLHPLFLPDNLCSQGGMEITPVITPDRGIQLLTGSGLHGIHPSSRLTPQTTIRVSASRHLKKRAWGVPIFSHAYPRQNGAVSTTYSISNSGDRLKA